MDQALSCMDKMAIDRVFASKDMFPLFLMYESKHGSQVIVDYLKERFNYDMPQEYRAFNEKLNYEFESSIGYEDDEYYDPEYDFDLEVPSQYMNKIDLERQGKSQLEEQKKEKEREEARNFVYDEEQIIFKDAWYLEDGFQIAANVKYIIEDNDIPVRPAPRRQQYELEEDDFDMRAVDERKSGKAVEQNLQQQSSVQSPEAMTSININSEGESSRQNEDARASIKEAYAIIADTLGLEEMEENPMNNQTEEEAVKEKVLVIELEQLTADIGSKAQTEKEAKRKEILRTYIFKKREKRRMERAIEEELSAGFQESILLEKIKDTLKVRVMSERAERRLKRLCLKNSLTLVRKDDATGEPPPPMPPA